MRLADGRGAGGGGTGVGGIGVGGTGVGGMGVLITTTGVGGTDVSVGSAAKPVVDVGTGGTCVLTTGGFPLAGNLQDVAANASITNNTLVKMILLFMLFSFAILSVHPI